MKIKNPLLNKRKYFINILYIILAILIFYNAIYTITTTITSKEYLSILGISFVVIEDNSMKPVLNKNDFLIIKKVNSSDINTGDLVAYDINNNINIHRVLQIKQRNVYITKADNNYYYDEEAKTIDTIRGKICFKIPIIGIIFKIFESKITTIFIIIFLILKYRYNKIIKEKYVDRLKKKEKLKNKKVG